ncbi:MAG: heme biosynthesis protein HemY [Rhodobacteraceae bacterium]|nr:heme biosynthesis protein HemY [Paracoccaceae bacterium]
MLWSLIKIALFVVLVAAAALGANHLLDMEGGVRIAFAGMEYNLTPLMAAIALLALMLGLWVVLKLVSLLVAVLKFINGDDTAITRYFDRNREKKGYQALAEGMMALASGEPRAALAKAAKAEKYLDKPELTSLLTAQAAEASGDRKKAEEVYKRLLGDDRTRFVGVRGIMKQKLADGDKDTARKLAEKAFEMKPAHAETQDVLLKLQSQARDWAGARKTLDAKRKHGLLPKDVAKRRDAVLALVEAKDVMDEGKSIEAREAAIASNKASPDLIPAAAFAARGYIEKGDGKSAARLLKKAWESQPHPDLAAAYAAIAPEETPQERIKRFQQLVKANPSHRESRLVMAELNLAAEDFAAARKEVVELAEKEPDARVLTIMAAVERGTGAGDAVVKGWLARALNAPRGPQWVCDVCGTVHAEWVPVCDTCEGFDTLSWKSPPAPKVAAPTGVEVLPLIVGETVSEGAAMRDIEGEK